MISNTRFVQIISVIFLPLGFSLHVEIDNKCNETLWPALTGEPNIELPLPRALHPGDLFNVSIAEPWAGRIWAKSHCYKNGTGCQVGDCGRDNCNGASAQNTTLVEFNVENETIWYDISLGRRNPSPTMQVHR